MNRKITDIFHPGELEAQRRFNPDKEWTERSIAGVNRLYQRAIDDETAFFVEGREFFFISTADAQGHCDCNLGNIIANPHIGLLFIDFANAQRLRVNGQARIIEDPAAYRHKWSTAKRYVHVTVEQVFWNCAKRIPKLR